VSTNNRWQTLAVKSDARKMRLTLRHGVSDQVGNEVRDSAAQQIVGRGRPRSEDKGQVVSCRLPAEELQAFDALDAGESVLVAAPTGSGKTVVAEYAIEAARRAGRRGRFCAAWTGSGALHRPKRAKAKRQCPTEARGSAPKIVGRRRWG